MGVYNDILDLRVFFALDYSQAEVRILAELTKDPILLRGFQEGRDIHSVIGHTLTGWSEERIKAEKRVRRLVKNMVFAIIFGVSKGGLYDYVVAKIREQDGKNADLSDVTKVRLGKLYDAFFRKYPHVQRWIDRQRAFAEEHGYVDTLFGFKREITKDDDTRDTFWGNQSVNSPVQGSAHQLMLIAMSLLKTKPISYNRLQTPVKEVHDALYFFVKVRELPEAYKQGKFLMEHAVVEYAASAFNVKLQVPLVAEAEAGFCLGSMVEYSPEHSLKQFLEEWRAKHKKVEAESWADLLNDVSV